ncbi:TonB-dependent receptor [Azospirillum sp. B4]|uniref:TonB-dependent receptor n=1 Tax=Azospirillum sp. B4 TaxID=95605 RepID=UPI000A04FA64|nr:TonB-dependent receptor [Azospirillum sp. B4]
MKALSLVVASTLPLLAYTAMAQENAPEALDEIIVTATKRSASLQRVPMAISAISGDTLASSGITEARALPQIAPSLFISTSTSESSGTQVRLRGVGTSSQNVGFEPSVGIFEDGVYLNRPGEALSDLMDVKRVEVLRGPQGTLYGKNTTTGVINVITKEPTFDWSGDGSITYGNYNTLRLGSDVSGPIVADKLAFRLSGLYSRRDGYIHDVTDGRDLNDRDRYQFRAQLLLKATETFSLRLIGEVQRKDEACCAAPYLTLGSGSTTMAKAGGTVLNPADEDNRYKVALNGPLESKVNAHALTAIANWDLEDFQTKVTYGHRYFGSSDSYDSDNSSANVLNVYGQQLRDRMDTLEAQLTTTQGPADLLFGVFGYDNTIGANQSSVFGTDAGRFYNLLSGGIAPASYYPAGGGDTLQTFSQSGRGLSLFTHDVIEIAPKLKATVGLRWLTEEKTGSGQVYTDGVADYYGMPLPARCKAPVPSAARAFCPDNPIGGKYSASHWTYALGLSYELTPDDMIFANYSTGYKGGGINAAKDARGPTTVNPATVSGTFAAETVKSYEVGLKSHAFDRMLTFNATAFLMDFDNFQFQTRDQTTLSTQVQTAASVRSKGVELELSINPAKGLTLGGNAAFIIAQYGKDTADVTLAGNRLGNSPKWTLQPFVTYSVPLTPDWTLNSTINARYVTDYIANTTLLAGNRQPGYAIVNASFTVESRDDLSISLYANNLFDRYYATLRTQAPLQANTFIIFPGEPRTFGVTVRRSF